HRTRQHRTAVLAETLDADPTIVVAERELRVGRGRPELEGLVDTAGGEHAPVGVEGDAIDEILVPRQARELPVGGDGPELDALVLGDRGQSPAVGAEGYPEHEPAMPNQFSDLLARAAVPDPDRPVQTRRRHELSVGAESDAIDPALVAAERADP